jgi:hypothetical protein
MSNNTNRVLNRMGARELSVAESNRVSAGQVQTLTLCTAGTPPDGDVNLGECS